MDPEREEELLGMAQRLAGRLERASVPALRSSARREQAATTGISPSAVSQVAAFLGTGRDVETFRRFVGLLDQLDPIVAQNQPNPKAEHAVLKRELLAFLREQPDLEAPEYLYVLRWAQRLLPKQERPPSAKTRIKTKRSPSRRIADRPPASQEAGRFHQIAAAFGQAKKGEEEA